MPAITNFRQLNRDSTPIRTTDNNSVSQIKRIRLIYSLILVLTAIFIVRLFYLQVIKHDYYRKAALASQLKQYEIPAERGVIFARDGNMSTPLVLNEKKYTLFADPIYIKDSLREASSIAKIIGGDVNKINELLQTKNTRYVVIAKKLSKDQSKQINALDFAGIGTREESYRTYPQGNLASQLTGFVNDEGEGQYGVEGFLNDILNGKPGELRAITDASGVPLVSNSDNIVKEAQAGDKIQLTIDINIQRQLEDILKAGLDRAKSPSGGALIIDANSGEIMAMSNYPTYDPAKIHELEDLSTLSNPLISAPLEVGSIMKPLTAAAALNQGVISKDTTYYDPAKIKIGDAIVSNVEEDGGPGTKSIGDFLRLSLNTGAVHLLKQMGNGEINQKGREVWHDYMVNHYGFGTETGIELSGEVGGTVPDPNKGDGLNITYANTSFGQGMSATLVQMAAAYSSVVNGGNYHKPHVVQSRTDSKGSVTKIENKIIRSTVTKKTSDEINELLKYVFDENHRLYGMLNLPKGYSIGGKTGTAQIAKPEGGYYEDRYTGTFAGFVAGKSSKYVIIVRVNEPKIGGFAGAQAAAPVFSNLASMIINNYSIEPQ